MPDDTAASGKLAAESGYVFHKHKARPWWDIHQQSGELGKSRYQKIAGMASKVVANSVEVVDVWYEAGFRPGAVDHAPYVLSGTRKMRARPAPGLTLMRHYDQIRSIIVRKMGRAQMHAWGKFNKTVARVP